jgi:hypothetical protein
LQEIVARFVMKGLRDRYSLLRKQIRHYPELRDMLAQCSKCAVCGEAFLNTWLECVHFVDGRVSFMHAHTHISDLHTCANAHKSHTHTHTHTRTGLSLMHTHTYIQTHTHPPTLMHLYIHTHITLAHSHTYTHTHTHTHAHIHTLAHHTRTHVQTHTVGHTHTHTQTHTRTRAHTQIESHTHIYMRLYQPQFWIHVEINTPPVVFKSINKTKQENK